MVLFLWGALFDERTGLSFVYAADPRQRSLSWVRVPLDSWPYFNTSDLRLPFRRLLRVAGWRGGIQLRLHTGDWVFSTKLLITTAMRGQNRKYHFQHYSYCIFTDQLLRNEFICCCVRVRFHGKLFTEPLPNNELFRLSGVMSQYEQVHISLHTAWDLMYCAKVKRSLGKDRIRGIFVLNSFVICKVN
jgi:hypothetical protein